MGTVGVVILLIKDAVYSAPERPATDLERDLAGHGSNFPVSAYI